MIDGFWLWIGGLVYAEAWVLGVFARTYWAIPAGAVALAMWLWGLRDPGH